MNIVSVITILALLVYAIRTHITGRMTGERILKQQLKGLQGFKLKKQYLMLCLLLIVQVVFCLVSILIVKEGTVIPRISFVVCLAVILISFNSTKIGTNGIANGTYFYRWSDFQSFAFHMELNSNVYYPDGKCLLTHKGSEEDIELLIPKESKKEINELLEHYIKP
jgi:hypothetical protein